MMYMHYCPHCKRMFMLNGHHLTCPKCTNSISELKIAYTDYVRLNIEERAAFKNKCESEFHLPELSSSYRMHKYSKWYRELQYNQGIDQGLDQDLHLNLNPDTSHPTQSITPKATEKVEQLIETGYEQSLIFE